MEFEKPLAQGFTVYSKSGCGYCIKIKNVLTNKHLLFQEINCDKYLVDNKEAFLSFIEKTIGKSYRTFPIVFYENRFVGGCQDSIKFVENLLLSFEDSF